MKRLALLLTTWFFTSCAAVAPTWQDIPGLYYGSNGYTVHFDTDSTFTAMQTDQLEGEGTWRLSPRPSKGSDYLLSDDVSQIIAYGWVIHEPDRSYQTNIQPLFVFFRNDSVIIDEGLERPVFARAR
jgi:hypothetical protein